jgi:hypothetical protein
MNDEMVMKRRGRTKSKIVGRMLNVLIYIFLHQQWKQCLEFALAKLREICKYLAGACNSNSHARGLHYLTFVCKKFKSWQVGRNNYLLACDSFGPVYNRFHRGEWITWASGGGGPGHSWALKWHQW